MKRFWKAVLGGGRRFIQTNEFLNLVTPGPSTQAAGSVIFDIFIGPPSDYSSVTNPSETFTVTVTNNSVPDDPTLTYTFTVNVTNSSPPPNTPPVALPYHIASSYFGETTLYAQSDLVGVGSDKDGDTVTVSAFNVEDQFVVTSSTAQKTAFGHITINPFTRDRPGEC